MKYPPGEPSKQSAEASWSSTNDHESKAALAKGHPWGDFKRHGLSKMFQGRRLMKIVLWPLQPKKSGQRPSAGPKSYNRTGDESVAAESMNVRES